MLITAPTEGSQAAFGADVSVTRQEHTHGLIVKPRPAREPHVSAPCPPGDYIFVHAGPAEAGGGGGSPPHLDYRVDIPKTLPAALRIWQ